MSTRRLVVATVRGLAQPLPRRFPVALALGASAMVICGFRPHPARGASHWPLPMVEVAERPCGESAPTFRIEKAPILPLGGIRASLRPTCGFRVRVRALPLKGRRAAIPEVHLRLAGIRDRALGVRLVVRDDRLPIAMEGFWVQGLVRNRDRLEFRVPLVGEIPVFDVLLIPFHDPMGTRGDFLLRPDPLDPRPPGDRIPTILIHGYDASHAPLPHDPDRDRTWETFRQLPGYQALASKLRFHLFTYRPWRSYPELARSLADEIRALSGNKTNSPVLFVGHSAGGLLARYAAADPRITPRIAGIVTLAGAHRGAITASILQANGRITERIGPIFYWMLRNAQGGTPDTPAQRSLIYDNFDGSIDPQAIRDYGVAVNPSLLDFNREDPNINHLIAYHGDVRSLWGRGRWGITQELQRRALAAFHGSWGSADPIVHRVSGLLEGGEVLGRRSFPNISHDEIVRDSEVLTQLLTDLDALARAVRARFHQAASGGPR